MAKRNSPEKTTTPHLVILVHGLARMGWSMAPMAHHLRRAGHQTFMLSYPSRRYNCQTLAREWISPAITRLSASTSRPVSFVTHSLGGVLVRLALAMHKPDNPGKIVMLAPPSSGSELADLLRDRPLPRWFFGPVLPELSTDAEGIWHHLAELPFPTGIIAGSGRAHPFWHEQMPSPNDGTVPVERTRVPSACDHLVIRSTHPFIMWNRTARRQTAYFIDNGSFRR